MDGEGLPRGRFSRRLAGRHDLARWDRRAVVGDDEERRARLRGGRLFRCQAGGELRLPAQRAGHTLSRGALSARRWRPIWRETAAAARGARERLRRDGFSQRLSAAPGIRIAWPTEANAVPAVALDATVAAWRAAGAGFYDWSTRSLSVRETPARRRNSGAAGDVVRNGRPRDRQARRHRRRGDPADVKRAQRRAPGRTPQSFCARSVRVTRPV